MLKSNMSRSALYYSILILFSVCAFAQPSYPSRYPSPNISGFFDVHDTTSVTTIDKINSYYVMQDMLNLAYRIEDRGNNRVHFELHLAGVMNYDFDSTETGYQGAISFKFNLFNPKIPDAPDILADIHKFHSLREISDFPFPEQAEKRILNIEDHLQQYNQQFWWKRLSVGLTVPFIEPGYGPSFQWEDFYLFAGYDFGDVVTLQLGMNRDKKAMLAVSVDLSTPLRSLAEDFKNMVSRLLGIPDGGYYYDYYAD